MKHKARDLPGWSPKQERFANRLLLNHRLARSTKTKKADSVRSLFSLMSDRTYNLVSFRTKGIRDQKGPMQQKRPSRCMGPENQHMHSTKLSSTTPSNNGQHPKTAAYRKYMRKLVEANKAKREQAPAPDPDTVPAPSPAIDRVQAEHEEKQDARCWVASPTSWIIGSKPAGHLPM